METLKSINKVSSSNTKTNREIADNYFKWLSKHYNHLKYKYINFCREKGYVWDEDIFSETYLRIYESICRKGLEDTSDQGFDNYTFISFKLNLKRDKMYARNQKRDRNVDSDSINELYESWFNDNNISAMDKVKSDLFKDFSILYIMTVVEDNFDQEDFYLFRIKTLGNLTYKQLQDKTKIKASRQKVINVKNFLKENVKKEDIKSAFNLMYGNLM